MDKFSTTSDNLDQADEKILSPTVSDEAIEAAAEPPSFTPDYPNSAGCSPVSDDYERKMQHAAGGLLSQLAAGNVEAVQRDVDTSKALIELIRIAIDMGAWPCPSEEHLPREAMLIEKWPEACRRASVGPMPMPDHMMWAIRVFVGRRAI